MWVFLVISALFTITNFFVDEIILPKWIATYSVLIIGGILSLPFWGSVYSKNMKWDTLYKKICFWTNCLVIIESLLALAQKYLIVQTDTIFFGSFDSITGLISALCFCLPMGFIFFRSLATSQKTLFLVGKAVCCLTIIIYESRIGIICISITLLYYIFGYWRKKKYWFGIFIVIIIFVCTVFFKTSSSQGRWFIIQRSLDMVKEHPIVGWGNNGFKKHYMDFQADYFSFHPKSEYALLANNIHHPINEYVLIMVNYGILVLILVLIIIFLTFFHSVKKEKPSSLEGRYILGIVSIYALFSYPFAYPFTYIIMILALILIYSDLILLLMNKTYFLYFCFVTMVMALFCIKPLTAQATKQILWKRVSILASETMTKDSNVISYYEKLYPLFLDDYNFLYDYACVAYNNELYPKALMLAKKAKRYIADYDIEILIADIYQAMNEYDKALIIYWWVHNMCPSRIAPYYESYKISRFQNDTIKCLLLYTMMNKRGVKIRNIITESMIYEIEEDIKKLRNNKTPDILD